MSRTCGGVLAPYYARLRAELERHGGTVEKFIGDAVMALFGAPVAHEDDPERAVRAALAIREAIAELNEQDPSLDLHVRVGVTTGEALVALGCPAGRGRGDGLGRCGQHRRPAAGGRPGRRHPRRRDYLAGHRPADRFPAGEAVQAKGKAEPVAVWQALEARASLGRGRRPGARNAAGRRERELEVLPGLWLASGTSRRRSWSP